MFHYKSLDNFVAQTLLTAMLSFMLAVASNAGDFYVSPFGDNLVGNGSPANPWKTIQYAVGNIFESNAILHVAAGTYQERVIVPQIAGGLDLIGAGAGVTTIDASGVALNGGAIKLPPGSGFTISGFTITGGNYEGSGSPGGAIRGFSAGSGFNEPLTSAVVENNIIRNNFSYGYRYTGGGISLGSGSIVRDNNFINNSSRYGSGAVYVGADSLVEGNIFLGNSASESDADRGGGAVEAHDPSVIVRSNIFQQNHSGSGSTGYGGAFNGAATVYNNLFLGNSTQGYNSGYGGAAYLTGGSFVNNTLVGNIGDSRGQASGVYVKAGTTVSNNIIVGGIGGVGISSDGLITADYNDIWNNDLGAYDGFALPGPHDIHLDPRFLSSSEYHLLAGSPCIDAGTNAAIPLGAVIDLDGNPRILGTVDMGVYETVPEPASLLLVLAGIPTVWSRRWFRRRPIERTQLPHTLRLRHAWNDEVIRLRKLSWRLALASLALSVSRTADGAALALKLDGINDYAVANSNVYPISTALHSFSVEAWVYPTSIGTQMVATDDTYDLLVYYNLGGALKFSLYGPGGTRTEINAFGLRYNQWNHVAGVYDSASGSQIISLNGVVTSYAYSASSFISDPNFKFQVGQSGSNNLFFKGFIDEVRISDTARYTSNFTPVRTFTSDANTKGLYHFDEAGSAATFADSTGNGNMLTGVNGAQTAPIGPTGDYNNDGAVDAADYVFWRKSSGSQAGYNTWRTNFGEPGGSGSGAGVNTTVPEPATLVMLIAAAAGVSIRRRWRAWPVSKLNNV